MANTPLPPLTNQTWDDQDTTSIQYGGGWFHQGTYNASNTHQTGTLSSTNDVNANFTFVFPQVAYGFYYYGIRRSKGASYQVCVDCDPDPSKQNWQDIPNTRNATDDGKNPPVVLFSQTWPTADVHRITITNRPDPNFNNTSQLTIDRIDLEIKDSAAPQPASTTGASSASAAASTYVAPSTAAAGTTTSNAALIGGIVGGVAVTIILFIAIVFVFLCLRRKRKIKKAQRTKAKLEEEFHSRNDELAFAAKINALSQVSPQSSNFYMPPSSPPRFPAPLPAKLKPFGAGPVSQEPGGAPAPESYYESEGDGQPLPPNYSEATKQERPRSWVTVIG